MDEKLKRKIKEQQDRFDNWVMKVALTLMVSGILAGGLTTMFKLFLYPSLDLASMCWGMLLWSVWISIWIFFWNRIQFNWEKEQADD